MKYSVVVFVCCVLALAAAAPQLIATTAWGAPLTLPATRTLVAGPSVWNGWSGWNAWNGLGSRLIHPGFVGTTLI